MGKGKKPKKLKKQKKKDTAPKSSAPKSLVDDASNAVEKLSAALREDPQLLDNVGVTMTKLGYAGDVRPPLTVYVAITSRFLDRPNNLAVVAESAAGKNHAVNTAVKFHPPDAVHQFSAASGKALIYTNADFCHRVIYCEESDSLPEDGPAATIIRSLMAENVVRYAVTEQQWVEDKETGKQRLEYAARMIEKEGPTGLITTSTRSLGRQHHTRVLEMSIPDDASQTSAIMLAQAQSVNTDADKSSTDLTPYVALQVWLAKYGEHRAVVPYAKVLASLVPATGVRMRRDFRQLLTFIQAIALLFQCQRQRTADGAIIATFDDYAQARKLLAPIFETAVAEGLTAAVRETVEVIGPSESNVSEAEVAQRLKLNGKDLTKGTISWRVHRAIDTGFLINDEWGKGKPARLRRGTALPDADTSLPSVDDVQALFELLSAV